MNEGHDKNAIERNEEETVREDGKVPVSEDSKPTPSGQDQPRNEEVAKQTV